MCPDHELLSAFIDGEIPSPWNKHIEMHVSSCKACADKIKEYSVMRAHLLDDAEPEIESAMERVRMKLANVKYRSDSRTGLRKIHIWNRKISLPIPLIAAAALIVICIGFVIIFNTMKTDPSKINIVTQKGDGSMTEVNITAKDAKEIEALLKAMETSNTPNEAIIRLPEGSNQFQIGEPELLRAIDFKRNNR
jgi:hypothetical protein